MIVEAILLFVLCPFHSTSQEANIFSDCTNEEPPSSRLIVHEGWPFRVMCSEALHWLGEWMADEVNPLSDLDEVQCLIMDESQVVVLNQTTSFDELFYDDNDGLRYLTPDVYQNSSQNYNVLVLDFAVPRCLNIEFRLNVVELEETTCQEFAQTETKTFDVFVGDLLKLSCPFDLDNFPTVRATDGIEINWNYQCSDLPGDAREEVNLFGQQTLVIPSTGFEHTGNFICFATYNGMTRYIEKRSICVRHKLTVNDISLTCQTGVVSKNVGESAEIRCSATFGQGHLRSILIDFQLHKIVNETYDERVTTCSDGSLMEDNVQCSFDNPTDRCYNHTPSLEDQQIPTATVQIRVVFRTIHSESYARYRLTTTYIPDNRPVNVTFTVQPNPVPKLLSQTAIAGICVGVCLVLALFVLIMVYNAVYIRVYWKRYFGAYVTDDKKYGAMLAYNFSSTDMDKFAGEQIQTSVPKIRKLLESMGYKVLDERKDGFLAGDQGNSIRQAITQSHRIVVFLTRSFIRDDWSLFAVHKGIEEMIKSPSKFVFIFLPGVKEHLKQYCENDDAYRLIQRAIKINYKIYLPNEISRRVRYQLEDAMPKLSQSSEADTRTVSSISSSLRV